MGCSCGKGACLYLCWLAWFGALTRTSLGISALRRVGSPKGEERTGVVLSALTWKVMEQYHHSLINHYPNLDLGQVEKESPGCSSVVRGPLLLCSPRPQLPLQQEPCRAASSSSSSSHLLSLGELTWSTDLHILVWKNKELQHREKAWCLPPALKVLCKLYPGSTWQRDATVLRNWDQVGGYWEVKALLLWESGSQAELISRHLASSSRLYGLVC